MALHSSPARPASYISYIICAALSFPRSLSHPFKFLVWITSSHNHGSNTGELQPIQLGLPPSSLHGCWQEVTNHWNSLHIFIVITPLFSTRLPCLYFLANQNIDGSYTSSARWQETASPIPVALSLSLRIPLALLHRLLPWHLRACSMNPRLLFSSRTVLFRTSPRSFST
jgi:hypothetical protein